MTFYIDPKESKRIFEKEYFERFSGKRRKRALSQAYEIRKFEIELYWKRATYFWALIVVAFVGYASFNDTSEEGADRDLLLLIISCIGFIFSIAWHFVNKGSKYWQENWENHVQLLEDDIIGPLYKTFTSRPDRESPPKPEKLFSILRCKYYRSIIGEYLVAPKPYSVSKINQLVSTYIAVIWGILVIKSTCFIKLSWDFDMFKFAVLFSTVFMWWAFLKISKSHSGSHSPMIYLRSTKVNDSETHKK